MARVVYQDQAYVVSDGEIDGDKLSRELNVPPGHDLVLVRPEGNRLVSRNRKVHPVDGDYFLDAPTFEYGFVAARSQSETRSKMSYSRMQRVYQEVLLLAQQFGVVDYDNEDGRWIHIPDFELPVGWDQQKTGLLLVLPSGYPHVPPNGFYIDRFLRTCDGHRVSHYFEEQGDYNPYADRGWGWFCIHLDQGAWRPTSDVLCGDNLLKLAALIRAILTEVAARHAGTI
jgi:hypothetical protein